MIPAASAAPATTVRRPFYRHLYFQVLIAIALGAFIGHFWPTFGESLKPLGDAFIKLVKMVIAPVIFLTIVTGIAGMRDIGRVGRVAANMILPYPPGVPLLMPGEMITEESRAVLDFLLMLCSVGRHYPGFETDIHGAKRDEQGVYWVRVLK